MILTMPMPSFARQGLYARMQQKTQQEAYLAYWENISKKSYILEKQLRNFKWLIGAF